jgi:simple sugar transport system permease protein
LTLPISILITAAVFVLAAVLTRRTALGTLIEAVGINPVASRLAGVRARNIIWIVYVFSAVCAAIAGLMISSNVTAADANNAGLYIEMDAILAVVIGGTSLAGGRYTLVGTVVGAFIIQTLTTTVYTLGIPPEVTLVFKALVVITVCLLQAPKARNLLNSFKAAPKPAAKEKVAI